MQLQVQVILGSNTFVSDRMEKSQYFHAILKTCMFSQLKKRYKSIRK